MLITTMTTNDSTDDHDHDNKDHHYEAGEEETIRIKEGTIQ